MSLQVLNKEFIQPKKKLVVIGANDLLIPIVNNLEQNFNVVLAESGVFNLELKNSVKLVKLQKAFFGLEKKVIRTPLPFYMVGLGNLLKQEKPDFVIVMDWVRVWYWQTIWFKIFNPNTKVIVYSETQRAPKEIVKKIPFLIFKIFYRVTERYISRYFSYTEYGFKYAKKSKFKAELKLLPVPVNLNFFTFSKLINKDRCTRILMNARFEAYKRHSDLLLALKRLVDKGIPVHLTLIGRNEEGRKRVEANVMRLDLSNVVTFKKAVLRNELPLLYHQHDILVLPSYNEAIGMVVPEAMASGLPTVTSDTVGANVYIKEGETGLIFPTGDIEALARALECLTDVKLRTKMGTAARQQIEGFSIEKMAAKIKSELLSLDAE